MSQCSPAPLAGLGADDGIAGSRAPELHGRVHVELDCAGVVLGGRQIT
jgi:hypothetical protein